jgi:NAD(P)-dependent dehydrogenase (short-subunit alcohol dehydrogenase family)
MRLGGKRCLITGAASGIGRATAFACARRGASLVLTDVDAAGLGETVARLGAKVHHAAPLDVTDYDAVRAFAREAGAVDVVMNVAGVSTWGSVQTLEHDDWRQMIEVNLVGPISVIEAFVPPMIEAGRGGHLVNVSSAAGLIGLPWHAAYSASKFGLRGVSEVLRFDLRRHGIGVTLVCPGGVDTALVDTLKVRGVDRDHPPMRRMSERFRRRAKSPEEVAELIVRGVERDRYLVHTSHEIRTVFLLQRVFPPAYAFLMRRLNDAFVAIVRKAAA